MAENQWPVLLSRLDFGWITTLHILYPPLTIGLASLLFFSEFRWVRSGNDHWYRLCRFFEKLLIINFAAGVATGITMEMAFGIYIRAVLAGRWTLLRAGSGLRDHHGLHVRGGASLA